MEAKPKAIWWSALQPTLVRATVDRMVDLDKDPSQFMRTINQLTCAYKLLPLDHMGHEALRGLHTRQVLIGTN